MVVYIELLYYDNGDLHLCQKMESVMKQSMYCLIRESHQGIKCVIIYYTSMPSMVNLKAHKKLFLSNPLSPSNLPSNKIK